MKNKFVQRLLQKEDPSVYQLKDGNLDPTLTTLDLIGLGTGMVVGTAIFTLPGIVAAIGAGLSALAYAETASVLPFARLGIFVDECVVRRIFWVDCRLGTTC